MNYVRYVLGLPRRYTIGGAVLIVAVVLGVHAFLRPATAVDAPSGISHVHISSVAGLSSQTGPLPVVGKVTSLNDATILAQTSGEIVSLSKAIGDRVGAGGIIAEFENSSQSAAVLQAQGSYDAAQAALVKASGSTADISGLDLSQANQSVVNTRSAAQAALQSAYAALDDAIHTKADTLFSNPRSITPTLNLNVPDGQLTVTIQNERWHLEQTLSDAASLQASAASSDTDATIAAMSTDAQTAASFLNDLIQAVNEVQPNANLSAATIAADQSLMGAARTEVVAAIASLTSAKSAFDNANSGAAVASTSAGASTGSDIAAAQANVKIALGALNAAKANLEKTIVRSPISGTIVSLAITQGDFVSAFSQVADVSNPSALEIVTYVTPDDAKTIAVGGKALIDGSTKGVIVSIAPALDPTTNKIQVKVGITGSQSALTDGDTVTVSLDRVNTTSNAKTPKSTAIVIPIIAAKITPEGPVVFSVNASSTLVAMPITLGPILGDQVTVTSGLSSDTAIVTDARGLSDGQQVIVDTQ
jgi:RND family efflux transporter MFP subunit